MKKAITLNESENNTDDTLKDAILPMPQDSNIVPISEYSCCNFFKEGLSSVPWVILFGINDLVHFLLLSKYKDPVVSAGLGYGNTILNIFGLSLIFDLTIGFIARVSNLKGRSEVSNENHDEPFDIFYEYFKLIAICLCIQFLISTGFMLMTEPILTSAGFLAPDIIKQIGIYLRWSILSCFTFSIFYSSNVFLLLQGCNTMLSIGGILVMGLNGFFGWLFISYLEYGLVGASLAKSISQFITFVIYIIFIFYQSKGGAAIALKKICTEKINFGHYFNLYWELLKGGLSCFIKWIGVDIYSIIVGLSGNEVIIAAYSSNLNLLYIIVLIVEAFIFVVSAKIGIENGKRNYENCKKIIIENIPRMIVLGTLLALIFYFLRYHIFEIYATSKNVVEEMVDSIIFTLVASLMVIINITLAFFLRSMNEVNATIYFNVIGYFLFGLPMAYSLLYGAKLGINGVFISMISGCFVSSGLFIIKYFFIFRSITNNVVNGKLQLQK